MMFSSTLALAETPYELFYVSKSGSKVEVVDAIVSAAKGESIYKCQSVEFKVSKSGTSISLKNVKKPKLSE